MKRTMEGAGWTLMESLRWAGTIRRKRSALGRGRANEFCVSRFSSGMHGEVAHVPSGGLKGRVKLLNTAEYQMNPAKRRATFDTMTATIIAKVSFKVLFIPSAFLTCLLQAQELALKTDACIVLQIGSYALLFVARVGLLCVTIRILNSGGRCP